MRLAQHSQNSCTEVAFSTELVYVTLSKCLVYEHSTPRWARMRESPGIGGFNPPDAQSCSSPS